MKNAIWYGSCLALPLLGALGCSDPVPPPAQGSATVSFGTPTSPTIGYNCPVNKTFHVAPSVMTAPDQSNTGQALVDGQGATVSCMVKGGGPYNFQGSLSAPAADVGGGLVNLSFGGTLDGTALTIGSASAYTSDLGGSSIFTTNTTDPALQMQQMCTFKVLGGQIRGGAAWATFNCPHMQAVPSTECAISGEFVFEDCDGS